MTGMENQDGFETTPEQEDAFFDEGFSIDDEAQPGATSGGDGDFDEGGAGESIGQDGRVQDDATGGEEQATKETPDAPAYVPPAYPVDSIPGEPAHAAPPVAAPASVEAKTVEIPEHIAEEFAELEKTNPEAARIAREDSEDGKAVRLRLEQYGAALAEDRARQTIFQRGETAKRQEEEQRRAREIVAGHNRHFQGTLMREVPHYVQMMNDPNRKAEAAQYQRDILRWIEAKPYSEGASLMQIAQSGRDPNQVAGLIKRFESERKGRAKMPDPTGALAVPARGAPVAPAGVGDKDDFDAGWSLNASA